MCCEKFELRSILQPEFKYVLLGLYCEDTALTAPFRLCRCLLLGLYCEDTALTATFRLCRCVSEHRYSCALVFGQISKHSYLFPCTVTVRHSLLVGRYHNIIYKYGLF